MRRILVNGGAGFVGSHTVELLLERGYHVTVFDNFSSGRRDNLPARHRGLRVIQGDILDSAALLRAMKGVDACLHLAAQVSVKASLLNPQLSLDTNVKGFINVLECLRQRGLPRLVYASSAAVYGDVKQLPVAESAALRPLSPYGLEKVTDEAYAGMYGQLYGTTALGLRYFNIYGPRQMPSSPYSGVITKFTQCFLAGRPPSIFGDGRQTRDFIYVADVAAANLAALESTAIGSCNVGTGTRASLLLLARTLAGLTGQRLKPLFADAAAGDIRHSCADVRRARKLLGFAARHDLHSGLQAYLGALR